MIKINKLRIINWHLFSNETANIEQVTFLTGANGTGKSTIIDAMQIVLLGDTTSRNFNKAANDKSTRTLLSYLKGDTGESADGNVNYIRNGRFSSYIVLEFLNDKDNSSFTLGVVFDIFDDNSIDHSFFYLSSGFPTNDFQITENNKTRPCTIKEFIEFTKKNYQNGQYKFFESNIAYQLFLKETFGNLPDKYFSLFKKAVSFTPISNISSFITEFVCDIDFKIDIEPMKRNIEQYKLLEIETKKIKDKVDSLKEIHEAFNTLSKMKQESLICDYLVDKVAISDSDNQIHEARKQISEDNARIDEILSIIRECTNDIESLERKKEVYLSQKLSSSNYSAYQSVESQKSQIDTKIANIKQAYKNMTISINRYNFILKQHINSLINTVSGLSQNVLSESIKDKVSDLISLSHDALKVINEIDEACRNESVKSDLLNSYQDITSKVVRSSLNVTSLLSGEYDNLRSKLDTLTIELANENKGIKPYPTSILNIKNELENKLRIVHPNAKVEFYCDLIDIKDKRWTKAIEAAIYSQKFNFFVDEIYFNEANMLLKQIVDRAFAHVSIVDASRLIERDFEAKRGSVAEVISSSHEGAEAYTNYLLGNIFRCETFEEARNSGSGLLPDCTGYRNYSTWYLNKRNADIEYIGTKMDSKVFDLKREEFNLIKSQITNIGNLITSSSSLSQVSYMSKNECDTNTNIINNFKNSVDSLLREKSELDETLKVDVSDTEEIDRKIKAIEEDIVSINSRKEKFVKEQGALENHIKFINDVTIPGLVKTSKDASEALSNKYDINFVNQIAEPFFNKVLEKYTLDKINSDALGQKKALMIRIGQQKSKLINLRSIYSGANNVYYPTDNEDSNAEYDNELNELENYKLPEYEARIKAAHNKAIKEFREDFIYKLRTSIETVKSQIDELNIALKDVHFGKDSYRFTVTPNKDFVEYYDMITSDLLLVSQVDGDEFSSKYGPIMEDLFSLISSNDSDNEVQKAQILQNIDKFTDYRTYLTFDLLVKRGNFQIESSLSRTFKKQSGGETQTPFYISILASFAQMYRVNKENSNDTLRIVIFDEAFSKMDSLRIREVVGLMKAFGLQAILSTPSEKIRDLADTVDTILVTMHNANKRRSYIDKYKEIK